MYLHLNKRKTDAFNVPLGDPAIEVIKQYTGENSLVLFKKNSENRLTDSLKKADETIKEIKQKYEELPEEEFKEYVENLDNGEEEAQKILDALGIDENTTQEELLSIIDGLNADDTVHGILVQLPLPQHINEKKVIDRILPEKDVDAFLPENIGHIMRGDYGFLPCTPAGVIELLHRYGIDPDGKECVVVGRSDIVGKPMAMMLLHENGTVTICHRHTRNLGEHTRRADILVAAAGCAKMITADMVKEGAAVIDVGMNRDGEGRLCGDVDFASVEPKASYITPVPGGVGPMTVAMLMKNTVAAAEKHILKEKK